MTRRTFLVVFFLVLALRVAALPLPGTEDVGVWRVWSFAASKDLLGVYGVGGSPPERRRLQFGKQYTTVDYPPLALAEMGAVGVVYRELFPGFPNDNRLTVAVKIPGLLAGIGLTWLLVRALTRLTGPRAVGYWGGLAFWANPAAILNGEVLGYLDPLVILPAIAALLYVHERRPGLAGAVLGLALLTKPQAMLIAPAVLMAAWHAGGRRALLRGALSTTAVIAAILLPYALAGALPNMLVAFGSWTARRDILSGYAANLWWVATWLARGYNMIPEFGFPGAYFQPVARILAISSWMEMGLPNPRPAGQLLTMVTVAWALWRGRRARGLAAHATLAAFTVHAFFVLGVSVHEHHMVLAVPLLVVAAAADRRIRPLLAAVSLLVALNINLFYGLGLGVGWAVPRMLTPIDLSVLLALANVALLVWHARVLARVIDDPADAGSVPVPAPTPGAA